jgi:hypothetical protein
MKKINIFDGLVVLLLAAFLLLAATIYLSPQRDFGGPAQITVQVEENSTIIYPEAEKKSAVYLNGQRQESRITDVSRTNNVVTLQISGSGTINGEVYSFNGQRILVGQKVELHGSFFARGIITNFELK